MIGTTGIVLGSSIAHIVTVGVILSVGGIGIGSLIVTTLILMYVVFGLRVVRIVMTWNGHQISIHKYKLLIMHGRIFHTTGRWCCMIMSMIVCQYIKASDGRHTSIRVLYCCCCIFVGWHGNVRSNYIARGSHKIAYKGCHGINSSSTWRGVGIFARFI
jgi:hypothetical protein